VRLDVEEEQATTVRRIFQMYGSGLGLASIAKCLNHEGVPAPQPPRTRNLRAWCPSSIREILRNERYRGVQVWNRTEKRRNPETGNKTSRPRPQAEWTRVEVPEWRIVSDALWNGVQSRLSIINDRLGRARYGGTTRTERSRRYLFSGILICGVCGSRMVIVSGSGRRGYTRYGCPSHRYRGVCSNELTIRQERLEEQLLEAIETRILTPPMMDHLLERFNQELERRITATRSEAAGGSGTLLGLQKQRDELQSKARRLAEAISAVGHSKTLLSELSQVENRLDGVNQQIDSFTPMQLETTAQEIRDFVLKNLLQLRNLLRGDPAIARAALVKHIKQLVLMPNEGPLGPVFQVSGEVDVMQVVARDGIEPPPAFSGPLIDKAKWFRIRESACYAERYAGPPLGRFGLIWAVFACSMFPYCSRESSAVFLLAAEEGKKKPTATTMARAGSGHDLSY
jgi:site-specific DNA recombinase